MSNLMRLKTVAWLAAVELALGQPAFAQDAAGATESPTGVELAPEAGPAAAAPQEVQEFGAPAQAPAAQENATQERIQDNSLKSRLLEEVVVTAQRREQNLQEVPSSVQAFSAAQLDAKGVSDIKDMQLVTPGLTFDSMASYSIIFIRGVGGDAFQAGIDSSVATYMDGLYLPFTFSSAQALGDVKQVEVLKGPQGTLYGRNAIAGAIKVELKEPCKDHYCGDVLQQVGNYKDSKTKIGFSGPVPYTDDTLSFGASALYEIHQAHDIYYQDPNNQGYYRPYRNRSWRSVLRWEPNSDFNIQGAYYDLQQQDADSVVTVLLKTAPLFDGLLTPIDKPHTSGNQSNVGVNASTRITTATANAHWFDSFDIRAVYGHIKAESTILFDYDSAPEPVLDISAIPNTARSDIAEMTFSSKPTGTPSWLEWISGVYYENTLKTGRYPIKVNPLDIVLGVPLSATGIPTCQLFTAIGLDCTANSLSNQNPYIEVPLASGITTDAISAYAQFTFHPTDRTSVVLGGRASREERKLIYSTIDARLIVPAQPIIGGGLQNLGLGDLLTPIPILGTGLVSNTFTPVSFNPQDHTWNSFTPNMGLNFQYSDDLLVYYRYAEAFKSGNYNGLNITNPPTRIEPELAKSNEVGVKSEWFADRSLKLNLALFSTVVYNAQVQTLSLLSGGVTSLQNAANYTVKGAEVEASWFATDALVFNLSADYLKGTYGNFIGRGFRPDTGLDDAQINFTGNETVRTPHWTATFAGNYTFALPWDLEGEIGADIYYNSGFYYDPLNTLTQPAYKIIGARFGVFDPNSNIRLTLYGKNLTDDVFFAQKYRQDFGDTGIYGAARTFGGVLTWSFGS